MPYVARNQLGNISCLFGTERPGIAEEFLPLDDPEVVEYMSPKPPTEDVVLFDHENRIRELEGVPPLTPEEFAAKVKRE